MVPKGNWLLAEGGCRHSGRVKSRPQYAEHSTRTPLALYWRALWNSPNQKTIWTASNFCRFWSVITSRSRLFGRAALGLWKGCALHKAGSLRPARCATFCTDCSSGGQDLLKAYKRGGQGADDQYSIGSANAYRIKRQQSPIYLISISYLS